MSVSDVFRPGLYMVHPSRLRYRRWLPNTLAQWSSPHFTDENGDTLSRYVAGPAWDSNPELYSCNTLTAPLPWLEGEGEGAVCDQQRVQSWS